MRLPLLALAVVLALTACGPAPGRFRPEATVAPVDAPLFSSDAEALAAAEEVYREYVKVSDEARSTSNLDDLRPLVTSAWFEEEARVRADFDSRGVRLVGESNVSSIDLQSYNASSVKLYACHVTEGVRLIDSSGTDITPEDRPTEGLLLVTLLVLDESLRVDGSELWSSSC